MTRTRALRRWPWGGARLLLITLGIALGSGCGSDSGPRADAGASGGSGGRGGMGGGGTGGAGGRGGSDGGVLSGIVVTTPSGLAATETLDGYCDILEAAAAANTDQPVHECPAGKGADRIILAGGGRYPVGKTMRLGTNVEIRVDDATRGKASIVGAAGFVSDAADAMSGCVVLVSGATADVKLTDVVLTQDAGLTLSGACATRGQLDIRNGRVFGFQRAGIVATCLPELGCDHKNNGDDATTVRVLGSLVDSNRNPKNGGGISSEGSGALLVVSHSAIVNNVSDMAGGGLYYGGGWSTHKIDSSTVSGNRAASGGGVLVQFAACTSSYLYVTNSTIANNTATGPAGGLEFHAEVSCNTQDVTVLASIINNNTSMTTTQSNINADWNGGQFTCDRGSLLYVAAGLPTPSQALGTPCRFDVSDVRLAPLMGMGGPDNLPLHALRAGSAAIDAALDDLAPDQQRDAWISLVDGGMPPDWTLFDRVVDGDGDGMAVRDVGAHEVTDRWQTELLVAEGHSPGTITVVTAPEGYERGAGIAFVPTGVGSQFVSYVVPVAEPGTYRIALGVRRAGDAGRFRVAMSEDVNAAWTDLGGEQDTYAASSAFSEIELSASHNFTAIGQKLFRFSVTGANAASAGRTLYLDYIRVTKLAGNSAARLAREGALTSPARKSVADRGQLGAYRGRGGLW